MLNYFAISICNTSINQYWQYWKFGTNNLLKKKTYISKNLTNLTGQIQQTKIRKNSNTSINIWTYKSNEWKFLCGSVRSDRITCHENWIGFFRNSWSWQYWHFLYWLNLRTAQKYLISPIIFNFVYCWQIYISIIVYLIGNCWKIICIRNNTKKPMLSTSGISKKIE